MHLKLGQLEAHLARPLARVYVVHGDETLLAIEAVDSIRAAARRAGYTERDVLLVDRHFAWSRLAASLQSMSLFGDRKLVELRIPTGKPGREGSLRLQEAAGALDEAVILIVSLPRLDREQRQSAWFGALEKAGVALEAPLVERDQLVDWIAGRLGRQRQSADAAALEFIAARVEGNLLAAHQEVQKLALLYPAGELAKADVEDAVLDVARHSVEDVRLAMLAGDAARLARTLAGLAAEGASAVFVHWVVTDEIRTLCSVQSRLGGGQPLGGVLRDLRVWGARERLYGGALKRLRTVPLAPVLRRAAELDKMAKGLRIERTSGDIWVELERLALMVTQPEAAYG